MGEPKRRWWRKKRWWAVGLLWCAVAYTVGRGPAEYAAMRGWITQSMADAIYGPLDQTLPRYVGPVRYGPEGPFKRLVYREANPATERYYRYIDWWANLGHDARHHWQCD
jgi:hypothetical protein